MADRSIEPVPRAFNRQASQKSEAPQTISKETADRLFMGMMHDQGRFGIGRSRLNSRMAVTLSALRNVLRRRR
jgi:hypothetical protein